MTNLYQAQSLAGWPYHVSAGGLVFKTQDTRRLYALLYRGSHWHGEESWHLPKGTLSKGETLLECAIREIKEESGLEVKLWGYLGVISRTEKYSDSKSEYNKTTHYFLVEHLKGDGSLMDKEHDRLDWYSPQEASQKLAQGRVAKIKGEKEVIERAERFLSLYKSPPSYE